jgi:hypothetical protein
MLLVTEPWNLESGAQALPPARAPGVAAPVGLPAVAQSPPKTTLALYYYSYLAVT